MWKKGGTKNPTRSGTLSVLLRVKCTEHVACQRGKIVVRKVVGHRNALHTDAAQFGALGQGELLNL